MPSAFGTIISEDFSVVGSLAGYTTVNPNSTWGVSGGVLNTSCTFGSYTDYVRFDTYGTSVLEEWKQTVNWKHTINGGSLGLAIGAKGVNPIGGNNDIVVFCATYAGGEGQITLTNNGTTKANNLTGLSISTGDSLTLTLERVKGTLPTYVATIINNTTSTSRSCTYNTIDFLSTAELTNTCCRWAIYNIGGDSTISTWDVYSSAQKDVDFCYVGYSIPEGYNSGSFPNSWPEQAMIGSPYSFTKLCSQSSTSQSFIDSLPELLACNAKVYIMAGILGNDKLQGVADATADANYNSLVSNFKGIGASVIHIKESPRNAFSMVPVNARIVTNAGTDTVVDLYTFGASGTNLAAIYDTDGTHPNQAWHAAAGAIMAPYIVLPNLVNSNFFKFFL